MDQNLGDSISVKDTTQVGVSDRPELAKTSVTDEETSYIKCPK